MEIISREAARSAGLKRYFTGVACNGGHKVERLVSNGSCIECVRARRPANDAKNRDAINSKMRAYRASNTEKFQQIAQRCRLKKAANRTPEKEKPPLKDRRRAYYQKNRERILAAEKTKYHANREKKRVEMRVRREKNKAEINARRRAAYAENPHEIRQKMIDARKCDPVVALAHRTRSLVRGSLRRTGYRKSKKTEVILGCSIAEFRLHLEKQFLQGMGWHNMSLWHIDHVVAIATAITEADVLSLNHFTNLRPLWGVDNLKKGAKQTHLI